MAAVKTAISIREDLFKEAERAARKMRLSRSQFFSKAVEEFMRRQRAEELTAQIDAAHTAAEAGERALRRASAGAFRKLVEGTW